MLPAAGLTALPTSITIHATRGYQPTFKPSATPTTSSTTAAHTRTTIAAPNDHWRR